MNYLYYAIMGLFGYTNEKKLIESTQFANLTEELKERKRRPDVFLEALMETLNNTVTPVHFTHVSVYTSCQILVHVDILPSERTLFWTNINVGLSVPGQGIPSAFRQRLVGEEVEKNFQKLNGRNIKVESGYYAGTRMTVHISPKNGATLTFDPKTCFEDEKPSLLFNHTNNVVV